MEVSQGLLVNKTDSEWGELGNIQEHDFYRFLVISNTLISAKLLDEFSKKLETAPKRKNLHNQKISRGPKQALQV